jgi:hypothetical protein
MSLTFLAILYCAVIANVLFPMVRFSSQTANYFFFALMQLIPLVIVALAFRRTGSRRYVLLAFGILVTIPATPLGFGAAAWTVSSVADGADRSFERVNAIATPLGVVAVYRTNGGAMTSFGIVLRQECKLAPGLLAVRNVAQEYPAGTVQLENVGQEVVGPPSLPTEPDDGKRRFKSGI